VGDQNPAFGAGAVERRSRKRKAKGKSRMAKGKSGVTRTYSAGPRCSLSKATPCEPWTDGQTRVRVSFPRFLFLFCLVLLPISTGNAEKVERYTVSIPHLRFFSGESVVSFEIDVSAGAIQSVANIPVGWYFVVDNDASWQTKITANSTVGAASLTAEEFKKLQFVIKKNEFGDLKFELSGAVSVTKDYEKEKQLALKMSDFAVAPRR